jgi:hypothetical protein
MGKLNNVYSISTGKSFWRVSLGRPRRRWEDNIREHMRMGGR